MSNFSEVTGLIKTLIGVVDKTLSDFEAIIAAGGTVSQADLDAAKVALQAEIDKVTAADPGTPPA